MPSIKRQTVFRIACIVQVDRPQSMSDKSFLAFVETNAQLCETETLEKARQHIADLIALRLGGKPPGLKRGVTIEASRLDYESHEYGEVTRLSPKSCFIQEPGSKYETRLLYSKYAIRVIEPNEWTWIERSLIERREQIDKKIKDDERERMENRVAAAREAERYSKKPKIVKLASNVEVPVYRGAYVHIRDTDDAHIYGVIVGVTPVACHVNSLDSIFDHRVRYTDCTELEILTKAEGKRIDSIAESRQREIHEASDAGNHDKAARLEGEYLGAEIV